MDDYIFIVVAMQLDSTGIAIIEMTVVFAVFQISLWQDETKSYVPGLHGAVPFFSQLSADGFLLTIIVCIFLCCASVMMPSFSKWSL